MKKRIILIIAIIAISLTFSHKEKKNKVGKIKVTPIDTKLEIVKTGSSFSKKKNDSIENKEQEDNGRFLRWKERGIQFEKKLKILKQLTDELNKYSLSGNAPLELKESYSIAKADIISVHKMYLQSVNAEITNLIEEGRQ